jgi:hypothetical protein
MNRQQLAYLCNKHGFNRVSCIGILNADGAMDTLKSLIELVQNARQEYTTVIHQVLEILDGMTSEKLNEIFLKLPAVIPTVFSEYRARIRQQTFFWQKPEYSALINQMRQLKT